MSSPIPQDFIAPKTYVDAQVAQLPKHLPMKWSTGLGLATLVGAIKDCFGVSSLLDKVTLIPGSILPTGQPVIIDVKVNGGSIYADNAHRPQLAPGAAIQVTPSSNAIGGARTFLATDVVSVDITQVGNPIAGTGLTVIIDSIPQA